MRFPVLGKSRRRTRRKAWVYLFYWNGAGPKGPRLGFQPDGWIKIGYSANVKNRYNSIAGAWPGGQDLFILAQMAFKDVPTARSVESALHRTYRSHLGYAKEWFQGLGLTDVKNILEYAQRNRALNKTEIRNLITIINKLVEGDTNALVHILQHGH